LTVTAIRWRWRAPATAISERPGRRFACLAAAFLILAGVPVRAAEHGEKASAPPPGSGPVFYKLPPIVLPVFEGDVVTRQASLVLALELAQGKSEDAITGYQRRLLDAFIGDLYAIYEQRQRAERVIDPTVIKPRLQASADRVLGPGVVREVLIQQAFERPRRKE
jgi:flagellar FliL protein